MPVGMDFYKKYAGPNERIHFNTRYFKDYKFHMEKRTPWHVEPDGKPWCRVAPMVSTPLLGWPEHDMFCQSPISVLIICNCDILMNPKFFDVKFGFYVILAQTFPWDGRTRNAEYKVLSEARVHSYDSYLMTSGLLL